VSKLWKFGRGITCLKEDGYVSVCVISYNGECYIVTFSARLVKCVKTLQEVGRGFSPRLGSRFST